MLTEKEIKTGLEIRLELAWRRRDAETINEINAQLGLPDCEQCERCTDAIEKDEIRDTHKYGKICEDCYEDLIDEDEQQKEAKWSYDEDLATARYKGE